MTTKQLLLMTIAVIIIAGYFAYWTVKICRMPYKTKAVCKSGRLSRYSLDEMRRVTYGYFDVIDLKTDEKREIMVQSIFVPRQGRSAVILHDEDYENTYLPQNAILNAFMAFTLIASYVLLVVINYVMNLMFGT